MFFRDRARTRRKVHLGTRPRLLAGTAIGTLATYLLFYHNYTQLQDDGGTPACTYCLHLCSACTLF